MPTADGPSEYVSTRRIGDAAISVISEGTLEWSPKMNAPEEELRRAIPELAERGKFTLGLNLAYVALADASILIDPGFDDPKSSWQKRFAAKWPGSRRSPGLRAALDHLGVAPSAVTHVLITHAHADHFAGVAVERDGRDVVRFPQARHFIGRQDWLENPAHEDPASELAGRLGMVDRLGLLEVVEAEREVAPGVTIIPAPGETPGHCVVRVRSAGQRFYYMGDLFHHPCEVVHPGWIPANRDPEATGMSRRRVYAEAAASGATVVFSHDLFPAWGRILATNGAFRWESAQ
ncbi:MAG TPA: MBL fold metallo-hydrolase [Methylomirabilota bacterium]|nr:MBL fold metallo-hydrolase [Methylomirabilota bacterium]